MEEYVQAAIGRGLRKIIFLEHLEEGIVSPITTWLSEADFDVLFAEGERLKKKYAHCIDIGIGVECGFNPDAVNSLGARLAQRSWNQVGISCHYLRIPGLDRHLNLFSRRKEHIELALKIGSKELLARYFETLTEAIDQLSTGTLLCHIDGALRHFPGITLTDGHMMKIEKLLERVKTKGMAIEVNTSGITIRQQPFPAMSILAKIKAYAIPLVLGSDAHRPEDVGKHFAEACNFILSTPSS